MAFGLCQMMSERRCQPSACRAKATRQGMPTKSLGFSAFGPGGVVTRGSPAVIAGCLVTEVEVPYLSPGARVAVAQVQPHGPVVPQHPPDATKDLDEVGDILLQRRLMAELEIDAYRPAPLAGI